MARLTNQELCNEFRRLLTDGAKTALDVVHTSRQSALFEIDDLLADTKPWRGELWRAFAEIERRLCPQPPEMQVDWNPPRPDVEPPPRTVASGVDFDKLPRPRTLKPYLCQACGTQTASADHECWKCEADDYIQSLMDRDRE